MTLGIESILNIQRKVELKCMHCLFRTLVMITKQHVPPRTITPECAHNKQETHGITKYESKSIGKIQNTGPGTKGERREMEEAALYN